MNSCNTIILFCKSCRTQGVEKHFKGRSLREKRGNKNGNHISCGGLTSHLTKGMYHKVCQQYYRNEGILIKDNQFDFSTFIFIGRYKKQKIIHSSSQSGMTRTDFHQKNTFDAIQNNALLNTQQSDNTNANLNNQVMHTVYHPPFDLTAV